MELLVIKSGENYVRVSDGYCQRCHLDKASVFPLSQLKTVRKHMVSAFQQGLPDVKLYRLILTEEPFDIESDNDLRHGWEIPNAAATDRPT